MDKEKQIASIKQRILDEHRKHKDLDWAEIAARKIYSTHLAKNCSIPAVVGQSEQLKAFIVDYISEFELEGATGWERYNEAKELIKSL